MFPQPKEKYTLMCEIVRDIREGELEKLRRDDSNLVQYLHLKGATTQKMKLQVFENSQGECLYIFINKSLTIKYKTYSIVKKTDISTIFCKMYLEFTRFH